MADTSYSQGSIIPVNIYDLLSPELSINLNAQKHIKHEMGEQVEGYGHYVKPNSYHQL